MDNASGRGQIRASAVISAARISATEQQIRPFVRRTPIVAVRGEELGIGAAAVTLKLELMQHAGSFKTRGAFSHLLQREVPRAGVVAASGGNHGAAVAYAAQQLGVPARIYVPTISSPAKIDRIRSYNADLQIIGERYDDALAASQRWAAQSGALEVHAFDHEMNLLGTGTLGLELEQQAPDLDTLLVGVGGGGLIAGVAAWYANRVKVVAVEPELAPTLFNARVAGAPVDAPAGGLAADSLAPRRIGELLFPVTQQFVREVVLVSDDDIRRAQQTLWRILRVVAEPGGSAAFAALLSGRYPAVPGERVGVVVSGGNTVAVDFRLQEETQRREDQGKGAE